MPEKSSLILALRDLMSECDMFNVLLPDELQAAARYFSTNKIPQGKIIFREGDAGTFMGILTTGTVAVYKANTEQKNIQIATLPQGRSFGEMAVLDGERRSAMCVTATECTLLILSKDSLDKMLTENPRVAAKVIRAIAVSLSRRLRIADGKLVDT
jgi:CRP-like cAMP-binding protein